MTIKINSTYKEPGYEVKDNVDNDLEVKIEGKVDTKKTGKYVLLYKVKDKSGNESSISREVIVEKSKVLFRSFLIPIIKTRSLFWGTPKFTALSNLYRNKRLGKST